MSSWACSEASKCCTGMAQSRAQHTLRGNNVSRSSVWWFSTLPEHGTKKAREQRQEKSVLTFLFTRILAEGAIALSVTLSGGALFASWKLLQFPSSLIVKFILAIFMGVSAQRAAFYPNLTSCQFSLLLLRSASQSFSSARNSRLLFQREWYALGVQFFHEHWFRAHTFSAFGYDQV